MGLALVQRLLNAFRDPDDLVLLLVPDLPDAGLQLAFALVVAVLALLISGRLVGIARVLLEALLHGLFGQPGALRDPRHLLPGPGHAVQEVLAVGELDADLLPLLVLVADPAAAARDHGQVIPHQPHHAVDVDRLKADGRAAFQHLGGGAGHRLAVLEPWHHDWHGRPGIDRRGQHLDIGPEHLKLTIAASRCQIVHVRIELVDVVGLGLPVLEGGLSLFDHGKPALGLARLGLLLLAGLAMAGNAASVGHTRILLPVLACTGGGMNWPGFGTRFGSSTTSTTLRHASDR
jgi:hypothetical protein